MSLSKGRMLAVGCGDGQRKGAEACDDGNLVDGDGCSSTCTIETGFTCVLHANGVYSICTEIPDDGMWMGQLECDDGDGINTNGCSNSGTINAGYYCPQGTVGAADVCPEVCGDTFNFSVSGGSTCDDGNNLPYDGCSPTCAVEPGFTCTHTGTNSDTCTEVCGDFYDFHQYQCNDGNPFRYDGCDDKCRIENGFICFGGTEDRPDVCEELCEDYSDWHHYECEYGPGVIGDGCNRYCEIEIGFFCNTGMPGNEDFCWPVCGDGRVVGPEECDDGPWINNSNTYPANTDGCYNCQIGIGWTCWNSSPYTPSHCMEICGDGYDFFNYPCDDGNLTPGDGCDAYCRIEIGFTCGGGNYNPNPDTCREICGDGKDFHWYQCDDGNLVNGDGCDSNCNIQAGWDCGYGEPNVQDFCWPLERPLITQAAISEDNQVILVQLNRTVLVNRNTNLLINLAATSFATDFTIKMTGPRSDFWYPMSYKWTNELQLKDTVGKDWFSFYPDYSNSLIQLFGEGIESLDITFNDQLKVYHSVYGLMYTPMRHFLINNYAFLGYLSTPKESSYKCDVEWWMYLAWWAYLAVIAFNIPAAIFFRVPMYYTWGITFSLQIVSLTPIMKTYLPSCLTFFLKDLMISHGQYSSIQAWFQQQSWLTFIYEKLSPKYNPLSYRLKRHDFIYNQVIVNVLEIYIAWICAFALIVPFLIIRIVCIPIHYWGDHFADLERSFRYQVFIRGFQLTFMKTVFCVFLNFRDPAWSGGSFEMASTYVALGLLIFQCIGMGVITIYVFGLMKVPLYKMRRRVFFQMIYDDFHQENRFSLLFFIFFFVKRIIYGIVLAFLADKILTPLNVYIFIVTMIPMLYFSYALPFKYIGLNALLCIDEFSEFLVGVVLIHYKDAWISDEEFFGYARFLIQYITVWILLHFGFLCWNIIYNLLAICCKTWTFKSSQFKEKAIKSESESDTDDEPERVASDTTPEFIDMPEKISSSETEEEEEAKKPEDKKPESSSDEDDFDIPAMAVYVDDKEDKLEERTEVVEDKKT